MAKNQQMIRIPSLLKLLTTVENTVETVATQIYTSEIELAAFRKGASLTLNIIRKEFEKEK